MPDEKSTDNAHEGINPAPAIALPGLTQGQADCAESSLEVPPADPALEAASDEATMQLAAPTVEELLPAQPPATDEVSAPLASDELPAAQLVVEEETIQLDSFVAQEAIDLKKIIDDQAAVQGERASEEESSLEDEAAVSAEAAKYSAPQTILSSAGAERAPSAQPVAPSEASVDATAKHAEALNKATQETGGIEILIQMAEKGEIDPKNIDIIDVTDRFLKAITAVPKENLRQSGKIIFQASILLRMKAEALLAAKVEEELNYGDDFVDFDIDGSPIIYDSNHQPIARQITLQDLERALVRQTKVRQMRHRRVTLEQLIEALREAERLEQSRSERKIKPRIAIDGYNEMRDMDDILELAHDEDIEDVIARIERLLIDLLNSDDLLPLLRIVEALGGRGDWVDAFLAVLFLSNAGKISLQQEQFYGPLFVMRSEGESRAIVIPPAVADSGPTVTH